ncbi:MAG: quinolinate synthase NadA [Phycisphaerae bacterium]|nr:quinolinate synthase NadA [Phycisphaerae bacterium]
MLWQPSLPEKYLSMEPADLAAAIGERRARLGDQLVILGHHYQTDEVIRHADITGDSLKLSQAAATLARSRGPKNPVRWIIFCGVHFMAETADMLTPDEVAVILPDLSAGCSMADMAAYDDTVQAWDALHAALASQGWTGRIIPITYVNSTAAIKAFVGRNGGACCTSGNAKQVFAWARAQGSRDKIKILFLPDQHLGRNTAAAAGIDVSTNTCIYDPRLARKGEELGGATPEQLQRSEVILWAGHCSVHKLFRPEHCDQVRTKDLSDNTRTTILVHPECCKEVVDRADMTGSTEFIIQAINDAKPGSTWAVGTEVHLVARLAKAAAARGVAVRILSDCQCLCTTMYRIDEPHLLWVLDHLAASPAKVVNRIQVHPTVRADALAALDRMLSLAASTAAPID